MKVSDAISDDSLQCNRSAMFISKQVNRDAGMGLRFLLNTGFFGVRRAVFWAKTHIKRTEKTVNNMANSCMK